MTEMKSETNEPFSNGPRTATLLFQLPKFLSFWLLKVDTNGIFPPDSVVQPGEITKLWGLAW